MLNDSLNAYHMLIFFSTSEPEYAYKKKNMYASASLLKVLLKI